MLSEELARVEATHPLTREALDGLELALRRFVERGESPGQHDHLQGALVRLKGRLESLSADLSITPEIRRAAQRLTRLAERALRALEFARRLRELRMQKGLTAERLADFAGINVSMVYRLERGGFAPPSRRTLQRLAQALQIRLDDLAPVQRKVEQPMAMEEAVDLTLRLDELSREEREVFFELVDWWAVRRRRYALVGPVAPGQERTLNLMRKLVHVLKVDDDPVRELRWAVLERVAGADGEGLHQLAECVRSALAGEQEKAPPG